MLRKLSERSEISIPPNVFGKGLYLPHHGTIIFNESSRFGDNCVVQAGVNVSENVRGGNHIYFAIGAKIIKDISLCSGVIIGANSVVTKSFVEDNIIIAGIPAGIVSKEGYSNRRSI